MPSRAPEVVDGAAVAGDNPIVAPIIAEDVLEVAGVAAAGFTVDALVGTHHFCHIALLHKSFEGGKVGFP